MHGSIGMYLYMDLYYRSISEKFVEVENRFVRSLLRDII
jgi:hypothetical protein